MWRQGIVLLSVSVTVIHCHLDLCFHWQINWTYPFRYLCIRHHNPYILKAPGH